MICFEPNHDVVWPLRATRRPVLIIDSGAGYPSAVQATICHSPSISGTGPEEGGRGSDRGRGSGVGGRERAASSAGWMDSAVPRVNVSRARPLPGLVSNFEGRRLPVTVKQI